MEEAFEVSREREKNFDLLLLSSTFSFLFLLKTSSPLPLAPPLSDTKNKKLLPQKVVDQSGGCGSAFEITKVVSSSFEAKAPLARHRLVNAALREELASLHALSIKRCLTPQEEDEGKK